MPPVADVTLELLSHLLAEAAIDYEDQGDNGLYVTGLSFNFWVRLDRERQILSFSTYWNFCDGVGELDRLRFINTLNSDLLMVQFSSHITDERLCGHNALSVHDGLDNRQFLRAARTFGQIFQSALNSPEHSDLLQPWLDDRDVALVSAPSSVLLN